MRLASAIGVVALALTGAACRTAASGSSGDQELAAKLRKLGVEGKTYANDLGQVGSMHLGTVYAVDDDLLIEDIHGHLTYVDGATLNPRWDYYGLPRPFDKRPDSTPSAIIGLSKGGLYVIDRSNGMPEVEGRRIDVVPSGAPVATDTTIYVPTFPTPSGNKTVQAVSIGSGYMGWGWRTDSDIVGAMAKGGAGAGDEFYFATSDGWLTAFPTYNSTEHSPEVGWSTDLHGAITNDLTLDDRDIGVVMTDGRLVCVDRIAGNVRWEAYAFGTERAEGPASFSPKHELQGSTSHEQVGGLAFYRIAGELRAFDRDTGAKAWAVKGATGFIAERGGRMLLSGGGGRLISVDKKTGEVLGTADCQGWTFPRRRAADTTIYAVSTNGVLMSVEFGF